MKKCDIVIPINGNPQWAKMCVYSIFKNTEDGILGSIFLVNDCDDDLTINCLNNLKDKYGDKIVIIQNKTSIGLVKTRNAGISQTKARFVLLLNENCIISKNAIKKMMNHLDKDSNIGLVCPVSPNADSMSFELIQGFNYNQLNGWFEKEFNGIAFSTYNISKSCVMFSRACIDEVGPLDESFEFGYWDLIDFQYKAMEKNFNAEVAIDTYVYYKKKETTIIGRKFLEKERALFLTRWKKQYDNCKKKYYKSNPIKYINQNIGIYEANQPIEFAFYLENLLESSGGVFVVADLINYLAINGVPITLIYNKKNQYKEVMLFNPIKIEEIDSIKVNTLIATYYSTLFNARRIADMNEGRLLYFIQGYECFFENGKNYGEVELSYTLADKNITVSKYLERELLENFNVKSKLLNNGIQNDILFSRERNFNNNPSVITVILRNKVMKGDWILLDVVKKISNSFKHLTINIVYLNNAIIFPIINNDTININKIPGPITREKMYSLLRKTDIFIDASLTEGFGLSPLEAMAAGAVPIVSNSKGVSEYIVDDSNGIVVNNPTDSNEYIKALKTLLKDNEKYERMRHNGISTICNYDFDDLIDRFIKLLTDSNIERRKEISSEYNEVAKILQRKYNKKAKPESILQKILPKPVKKKGKKAIKRIYKQFIK